MSIRKSIHVARPVEEAFAIFTGKIASWWPLKDGFSFGRERADKIFIEGKAGGRFFERFTDGEEYDIGVVKAYAPPSRIVFSWNHREAKGPTEVEVRFTAEGNGTRVDVEHRGWEEAGAQDQEKSYNGGWDFVLGRYAAAA
jgi:uncharacterized protein YndB with AHSA1/START domain